MEAKAMKKQTKINKAAVVDTKKLVHYARLPEDKLLKKLNTTTEGLTEKMATIRLAKLGKNEIIHQKPDAWYVKLIKAFMNPFIIILICLATVSFILDFVIAAPGEKDLTAVVVIMTMVILSGVLRFVQEYKADQSAQKLKDLVTTEITIARPGKGAIEENIVNLVQGDVIHLSAGDMIPADVRILKAKDLFISQSTLTGESAPVEKYYTYQEKTDTELFDITNLAFMGTNVISGTAQALVLETGNNTYFGTIAQSLMEKPIETSFDKGVKSVSYLLIRFTMIMVPIVFVINGVTSGDWLQALLFSLSVAVGLTPEMLPMIVSANLAKGAHKMAQKKTVVKQLSSIQNFGAMDILCTDKTGTLTEDKIILETYLDIDGNEDERILRHAYLNSYFQTGLKNLIDVAIIEQGDEVGFQSLKNTISKVDEIPFDFERRRMSVVVKDHTGKTQMVTKGAVEEMLDICSFTEYKGQVIPLTETVKAKIEKLTRKLNNQGMRVIVVAQKTNPSPEGVFGVKDETEMVLIGCIGLLDPPKLSSKKAVAALHDYGVDVKVLTGDNELVARSVCNQVGLDATRVLLGQEIENMEDSELLGIIKDITVFAKLSPMQKQRLVRLFQELNHTVGFMGDGINDAAAMKQADVGISVDSAVDIAKESADIILLEKDLMVLEEGVIEGRKTFGNIIKYIKMTASSNFGNMFSVLVASAFLPFLPMLPIQLLALNLIYDISQTTLPWDNVDEEYLIKPRKWDASGISKFMIWIGPTSSIFDITTYLLMYFVFQGYLQTPEAIALFHTGWFIESLFTQTLVVHLLRTKKIPFLQSRASGIVMLGTVLALAVGLTIPYTVIGETLGMVILPGTFYFWLAGTVVAYGLVVQVVKGVYIKKYKTFL